MKMTITDELRNGERANYLHTTMLARDYIEGALTKITRGRWSNEIYIHWSRPDYLPSIVVHINSWGDGHKRFFDGFILGPFDLFICLRDPCNWDTLLTSPNLVKVTPDYAAKLDIAYSKIAIN